MILYTHCSLPPDTRSRHHASSPILSASAKVTLPPLLKSRPVQKGRSAPASLRPLPNRLFQIRRIVGARLHHGCQGSDRVLIRNERCRLNAVSPCIRCSQSKVPSLCLALNLRSLCTCVKYLRITRSPVCLKRKGTMSGCLVSPPQLHQCTFKVLTDNVHLLVV
jgi:hypothetical protein